MTASDRRFAASVVVATYQRPGFLAELLNALERQTMPLADFEVIVVDDCSQDETPRTLEDALARSHLNLVVDRMDVNGGPARARNRAVELARAEIVAFTDDDCLPTPGWLDAGVKAVRDGARVVVGRTEPLAQRTGPFSRTLKVDTVRWYPTANVFYRTADVRAVGAFDPSFRFPGGEDTDLALRVLADGGESRYVEAALVRHRTSPNDFRSALRTARRWEDIPLLFRLHPQLRNTHAHRRWFWRRSHVPALASMIGLLAALAIPAAAVLVLPHAWYRLRLQPEPGTRGQRVLFLPGVLVIDLLEVVTLLRGSLRHRFLLV